MANTTLSTFDKLNTTLTGSNLIATGNGTQGGVRSEQPVYKGKYYWEATVNFVNGASAVGVSAPGGVLLHFNANDRHPPNELANTGWFGCFLQQGGLTRFNGNFTSVGSISGTNKLVCFALDMDNGRMSFRVGAGGNWNNNVANDPATGFTDISTITANGIYALVLLGNTASENATMNFGGTAFGGSVPSGFTSGFPATAGAHLDPTSIGANEVQATAASIAVTTGGKAGTKIQVVVATEKTTSAATSSTVVGASLGSFTLRNRFHSKPSTIDIIIEVWEKITLSDLAGEVVTATFGSTNDKATIISFGIANPVGMDANVGFPYTGSATATQQATVTGINSTNAKDFILEYFCHTQASNLTEVKAGTGNALLQGWFNHASGVNWCGLSVFGRYVDSTLSSGAVTSAASLGANGEWIAFVEGFEAALSEADLTAAASVGITEAATLTLQALLAASDSVGATMAVSLAGSVLGLPAAAPSVGVTEAVTLTRELDVAATSPAVGVGMSVVLSENGIPKTILVVNM